MLNAVVSFVFNPSVSFLITADNRDTSPICTVTSPVNIIDPVLRWRDPSGMLIVETTTFTKYLEHGVTANVSIILYVPLVPGPYSCELAGSAGGQSFSIAKTYNAFLQRKSKYKINQYSTKTS